MITKKEIQRSKAFNSLTETQKNITMSRNNIVSLGASYKLIENKGFNYWESKSLANYQNQQILKELWDQRHNIHMRKIDGGLNALEVIRQSFETKLKNLAIDMEKSVDFKFSIEHCLDDGYLIVNSETDTTSSINTAVEYIRAGGIYTKSQHANNLI